MKAGSIKKTRATRRSLTSTWLVLRPKLAAITWAQPAWLGMDFVLTTDERNASPKAFNWAVSFSAAIRSICLIKVGIRASARMQMTVKTPIISIKVKARDNVFMFSSLSKLFLNHLMRYPVTESNSSCASLSSLK